MSYSIEERRPLGTTGLSVSPIGLGGAWIGFQNRTVDDALAVRTVLRALELGVTLIDTSGAYLHGRSEELIGEAIKRWRSDGGKRSSLVISTKTGTRPDCKGYTAEVTRRSIEQSLRALGTEYIDVALVHDAGDIEEPLARGAAFDELWKLKEEGLVRAVGLGLRDHHFHRRALESGKTEVHLTYAEYNLLNQSAADSVIEPAAARGAGVFNAMITAYGLLAGPDPREIAANRRGPVIESLVEPAHELWEWAAEHSVDLLALAVQFSLRNPSISATPLGASSPEQIEADVRATETEIPESVWDELANHLTVRAR